MFLSLVCPPSIHSVSHCLCTFVFFYQRYSRSPPAPVSSFFAYHDYTAEFSTARKFTSEHASCYAASDSGAIPSAFDFKAYSHREYVTSASTFASPVGFKPSKLATTPDCASQADPLETSSNCHCTTSHNDLQ